MGFIQPWRKCLVHLIEKGGVHLALQERSELRLDCKGGVRMVAAEACKTSSLRKCRWLCKLDVLFLNSLVSVPVLEQCDVCLVVVGESHALLFYVY